MKVLGDLGWFGVSVVNMRVNEVGSSFVMLCVLLMTFAFVT